MALAADVKRRRRTEALWGYAFLTPQLIGLIAFMVGPLVFAIVLSFSSWDGLGSRTFVGLQNFIGVWQNAQLRQSWLNTAWFTALQVPGLLLTGFFFAFFIQKAGRLTPFYRIFFFAPQVTSTVAVGAIWLWLLNPEISPINSVLKSIGLPNPPDWLQNPRTAIPAIVVVSIWQGLGYMIVMFVAGLQNISPTLMEAADIDGASEWQKLRRITVPLLSPTILFLSITSIIGSFQVFDYIYFFFDTTAPANAHTIVYDIVNIAFREFKFGFAAAIAVYLFLILLVLTGLQFLAQKRWVHYTE
ncbi:sugar ABC transporter permease [Kribbella sp. NBC_00482]|uniref:carbohydrate ABC transporter permease n=1 Tax=Kribbella sp. NBC_00482 TaxID=2975968 RepID=UPI002E185C96